MKKKYVLNFDGNQHGAIVARQGNKTQVAVDSGDLAPVSSYPVLQGKAIIMRYAGKLHLVHLTGKDSKGTLLATINGRPVKLSVMDELRAQALDGLDTGSGSGTISADIPGLVVEIKVSPGQTVSKGDPVIVVEAMKMQNELCSAIDGIVTSLPVTEGQAVNPGDPLVVIEPAAQE